MTEQLLEKANDCRLSNFAFRSLGERELTRLWRDQTFPPEALVTGAGERLRVVYRGRAGGGAGPDFRDAVIAAPGGLMQGDVELHVRSSDFHRHGHDRDPAYAGVVLHLVFHDDQGGPTRLPGGGLAAVVALGDWARGRAAEIERWLERPALWREPCFSALHRLGAAEVGSALERLGEMRFRQKAAAFARRITEIGNRKLEEVGRLELEDEGWKAEDGGTPASRSLPTPSFLLTDAAAAEQVLWEALLEAPAFGSARAEFRRLAQRLPWAELRLRLAPLAAHERGSEAWRLLAGAAGEGLAGLRGGGRPAGRPERRLRGAAQLAARFADKGLVRTCVDVLETRGLSARGPGAKGERAKSERSNNYSSSFPISDFDFRSGEPRRPQSRVVALIGLLTAPGLIGRSCAVEMVGNAVLPCLAALGPEARTRLAEALYRRLPLPARYGAVRHLHEAVGADARSKNGKRKTESGSGGLPVSTFEFRREDDLSSDAGVRVDFRRQQGMLYLLKQYCTQGGCGRCPLS